MAVVRDCGKARSTSYPGPVQLQSDLAMLDRSRDGRQPGALNDERERVKCGRRDSNPDGLAAIRERSACDYAGRTFSARGPFGPCPTVNVTASPSRSESNGVLVHAELWKKYSVPSGVAMKPKPLSVSRLMVPFDDMRILERVAAGAVSRVPEVCNVG